MDLKKDARLYHALTDTKHAGPGFFYLRLRKAKIDETIEVKCPLVTLDFDTKHHLIGIEFFGWNAKQP